jgi:hypothetical protein
MDIMEMKNKIYYEQGMFKQLRCMRFEVTILNADKAYFSEILLHICHTTV